MFPLKLHWFERSVLGILSGTALIKIIAVFGNSSILSTEDPLTGINNRSLIIFSAAAETTTLLLMIRTHSSRKRLIGVLWLSSLFALYHLYGYFTGLQNCPCLGYLFGSGRFGEAMSISIPRLLSTYMWVGCVVLLFQQQRRQILSIPDLQPLP
jgi:hypothetical protein